MNVTINRTSRQTFPLRLPRSLEYFARQLAKDEGVSFNFFVTLALQEKITRMSIDSSQSGS